MKKNVIETSRTRNLRPIKKIVYISCEGDAEEAYLIGLKNKFSQKATLKISNSKKTAAIDVVKNLKTKFKSEYSSKDLKFCVFDFDENTEEQLETAKKIAQYIGAKVIFSNPCFEIWLLWHFKNDFSIQDSREKLKNEIEKLIRPKYWSDKEYPNLYDLIKDKCNNAQMNFLQRKEELQREEVNLYSSESNPYTNFDELLEELIKL